MRTVRARRRAVLRALAVVVTAAAAAAVAPAAYAGEPVRQAGACVGPVAEGVQGRDRWESRVRPESAELFCPPQAGRLLTAAGGAAARRRTRTAMTIALTPARPYRNATLTATGTVTQLTAKGWVRFPHARVVLAYRPKGSATWYWVVKGRADSRGRYKLATKAYGDGTWAAYLDADSAHSYSETRQVYVRVR